MISFFVPGVPAPGGSKRAFPHKNTGRIIVIDACKRNKEWRETVALYARQEYKGEPIDGPLFLRVTFFMPRPKYHYGKGRNADRLKGSAPKRWHTVKPDATKLLRSTEDALTDALIWHDDAQVVQQEVWKVYAERGREGAQIEIRRVRE